MVIEGTVHCFFEQSGTFKNEFIKLGIPAMDYDIQDNFGQTDFVMDLFNEIETAYGGGISVFDSISSNDLIMALFPCIYFCENNVLYFTGLHRNLERMEAKDKADILMERSRSRQRFWEIALMLFTVCDTRGLRLVVENPSSGVHYLHNNFPYKAALVDHNRGKRGDFYNKPTQYWFINCSPTCGESFQAPTHHKRISSGHPGVHAGICSEDRSTISPDYARNFICDFILGKKQEHTTPTLF